MNHYAGEMRNYMRQSSRMLGESTVPVRMDYSLRNGMDGRLKLIARKGLEDEPPFVSVDDSRQGHSMYVGLAHYRWVMDGAPTIDLVRIAVAPQSGMGDFWAVPASRLRAFYKRVRKLNREKSRSEMPILSETTRRRLWGNTVGLLSRSQAMLDRFGVAMKRGVLLMGEPGNGKTMACRWLARECRRSGLEWRNVTADYFSQCAQQGRARELFELAKPGIILFDDFDTALRDRERFGESAVHSTFLTELDGLRPKHGVVYLFTSNHRLEELDPAIRRPGRIDVMINFPRPNAELRGRYVAATWQSEILAVVDVDQVVRDTEGFSFAEVEESRRLLVMNYFDTEDWDWQFAVIRMRERSSLLQDRQPIGFSLNNDASTDEFHPATSAERK